VEVFFLITTGRGSEVTATSARENEEVCNFLVDASRYGFTFARSRLVLSTRRARTRQRHRRIVARGGRLHVRVPSGAPERTSRPSSAPVRAPSAATRDGKGIIFVGANATSSSDSCHHARERSRKIVIDVYRDDELLRSIRSRVRGCVVGAVNIPRCAVVHDHGPSHVRNPWRLIPAAFASAASSRPVVAAIESRTTNSPPPFAR